MTDVLDKFNPEARAAAVRILKAYTDEVQSDAARINQLYNELAACFAEPTNNAQKMESLKKQLRELGEDIQ